MHKIFFFAIPFFLVFQSSCMIIQGNSLLRHAEKDGGFDAVIIPGVPYNDSTTLDVMNLRVRWAHYLYSKGIARNLIFSGSAVYSPYVEACIMAMMAEDIGIPAKHIYLEEKAEHSTENMYYGYWLAQENGLRRVAVASDPFQTFMLSETNERFQLDEISFLPMPRWFIRKFNTHKAIEVNPESAYVGANFIPLPSRKSPLQRFRGTLGKGVKNEIKKKEIRD